MRRTQPDGLARIPRDLCCGRPHLLEVAPPPELAPFAAFGWCHRPDGRAHHILADGEMDLMLLLESRTLLVSGPRDEAVRAAFAPPATMVGLRLRLGVGARLLDVEPGALHNARVPLRELGGLGRRLAERVEEAGTASEALAALLQAVSARARATPPPDPAAAAAVRLIRASRGRASMRAVRQELGLGSASWSAASRPGWACGPRPSPGWCGSRPLCPWPDSARPWTGARWPPSWTTPTRPTWPTTPGSSPAPRPASSGARDLCVEMSAGVADGGARLSIHL